MCNTKNDIAWRKIFKDKDILRNIEKNDIFEITSSEINKYREARLMTKFDHKKNLPVLFKENKLSILPITRGKYLISQFDTYKNFEEVNSKVTKVSFPRHIQSIDFRNITSEATALNCAYVSGILADFVEDEKILPTVSGRMSSGSFSFNIQNIVSSKLKKINITNSQIEIDGGYEGVNTLALIEAKNSISDDFIIRQLYYPYRLWEDNINKKVKPIFLTYSNGIFTFYEYEFQEICNYNSLNLIKQKKYSIEETKIELKDILEVLDKVKIVKEPQIPFPQANSFKRIVNLCELLNENELTKEEITINYDFDERQTDYYTNACIYLGLINKTIEDDQTIYSLTPMAKNIFEMEYRPRQLKFIELILEHQVFNETFKSFILKGKIDSTNEIVKLMKSNNLYKIESESTYVRRASTILGWVNWIIDIQN